MAVTLPTGRTATAIVAGNSHTCAILDDDSLMCWGYNYVGQLGDGTTTDSYTPVAVIRPGVDLSRGNGINRNSGINIINIWAGNNTILVHEDDTDGTDCYRFWITYGTNDMAIESSDEVLERCDSTYSYLSYYYKRARAISYEDTFYIALDRSPSTSSGTSWPTSGSTSSTRCQESYYMLEFESSDYLFYNSGKGYSSSSSLRCNAAYLYSKDYMLSADENGFYFTSNSGYNSTSTNYGTKYYNTVHRYDIGSNNDLQLFNDFSSGEIFMYQGMFCSADSYMTSTNAQWFENKIICHEGTTSHIRLDNDMQYNLDITRQSYSDEYIRGPAIVEDKLFLQCGQNHYQLCVIDLITEIILS